MYLSGDRIVEENDVVSKAYYIAQGTCSLVYFDGYEEQFQTTDVVFEETLFAPAGEGSRG